MGFFDKVFGYGEATPKKKAEKQAFRDHAKEHVKTGKDPIPTKTPDWAKNSVPDAGQKK